MVVQENPNVLKLTIKEIGVLKNIEMPVFDPKKNK